MRKNFNEVLKERELREKETSEEKEMSLDSSERVKVLSPGQMVFKRFITNRLAVVGSAILIFMFVFAFIAPIFYPYGQTEIFYKYDNSVVDLAQAKVRNEYTAFYKEGAEGVHSSVRNKLTSTIISIEAAGAEEGTIVSSEGDTYTIEKNNDAIYSLFASDYKEICNVGGTSKVGVYDLVGKAIKYEEDVTEVSGLEQKIASAIKDKKNEVSLGGVTYSIKAGKMKKYDIYATAEGFNYTGAKLGAEFEALVSETGTSGSFEYNGKTYSVKTDKNVTTVSEVAGKNFLAYLTTYAFDAHDESTVLDDSFKFAALDAIVNGEGFSVNGESFTVSKEDEEFVVYRSGESEAYAALSTLVIRRATGEDNLELALKEKTREVIEEMDASGERTAKFSWEIAQVDANGEYTYDENGDLVKEEREITVTNKNGSYTLTVEQVVYLIDTFASPSKEHIVGTDGDGMDVFARMMYGGRVSLMVAFVVVILETILGVIMGGIAGFFGGWVDNLIMRMVDIFYCIPSMPILIIMGALFDAMKMKPYHRLAWLMVVLGVLGWAGVARLVRGQILSLREQEFMVAAEAIGLRTKRRIFTHLVPNVMPQLIVTATSALGGVIITESTLSFLGLGVKHPLATWGTMINSVSTAEAMKAYTYIWVPVGLLICLTVVAFNFVGDGLRDAFDPKMKR